MAKKSCLILVFKYTTPKLSKFWKLKNAWRHYCFTHDYQKQQSYHYGSWDMKHDAHNFLPSGPFFPFYPTSNPQNKFFAKLKNKNAWRHHHMCSINDNHIMYDSWDMESNGHNFWSLWSIFWSFYPLTTWKVKISKKYQKFFEISSFYTSVPKITMICYTVSEIWRVTNIIVIFSFWAIFCPFTLLNSPKNQN